MELRGVEEGCGVGPAWASRKCIIGFAAFLWAFFQLFIASPVPFWLASQYGLGALVFTGFKARAIHLSFALFLLYLVMPPIRGSKEARDSLVDWPLALLAAGAAAYVFVFYDDLATRIAMPNTMDLVAAALGVLLLLEAARRAIGFPIIVVATTFLLYAVFGYLLPDMLAHKGHGFASIASHEWLSPEGVFGVALGVSCNFVFLYVLFGALMDKAGAGAFFMRLSYALLRGSIGGPAKAAVVASGFMGMMSGSSVANTITIGSFTIPLMKKMGMPPEKAAAVEVSAGINGQVTPPVMGAAAFLMAEFLSLPYSDIVRHALIPAVMVYVGLLVIVHLEACKLLVGQGASKKARRGVKFLARLVPLLRFAICAVFVAVLFGLADLVVYGLRLGSLYIPGVKAIFAEGSVYIIALIFAVIYIGLRLCKSERDGDDDGLSAGDIVRQGLHYFVPVFILVWSLMVERASTPLACFWTNGFLIFMLMTENVILSVRKGKFSAILPDLWLGVRNVCSAMVASSKNMLPVAVATATAGIVVGTVGLTGFGLTIGSFVDELAGGSVFTALLAAAVICIVLGMGMPTTGCYIIVSTLVVPVLGVVAHKNGLFAPPVALHLFVLYFGLMADVTPPVGIASYAAAAIASANSFKTGVQSFLYNVKTMVVPFMFVFNDDIILHSVENVWEAIVSIVLAFVSIIALCAGMQGYFVRRNHVYESVLFIAMGVTLIMPNYVAGVFMGNREEIPLTVIEENVISVRVKDAIRVEYERATGGSDGPGKRGYVVVPVKESFEGSVAGVISRRIGVVAAGLKDGRLLVSDVIVGSYVSADVRKGDLITGLSVLRNNNNGNYVIALSLLALAAVVLVQARSRKVV
ncbi:MAG: TRAP transporter fused permease subunit [Anaplasma sp.]